VKRRTLIQTTQRPERRADQLALVAGVAAKALELGKVAEAERLLASAVADFETRAERAMTGEQWTIVARMHGVLAPILPRLEAATGKPWTRCLELVKRRMWTSQLPRGLA
jgi:hypothetical protein